MSISQTAAFCAKTWKTLMVESQPIILKRKSLNLQQMNENDVAGLTELAKANISELKYTSGPWNADWYEIAFADFKAGKAVPFTIRLGDKIVGATRFADINPTLPAAEMGWTWMDPSFYGKGLNTSVKYLMLTQAFDAWKLNRLQIKTAENNKRSQKAIEKLGAVREGLLRNHRRLLDGTLDGTMMYSITYQEWPAIKEKLERRMLDEQRIHQSWCVRY